MSPTYKKLPETQSEWSVVANAFERKWQFQNCLGAIDGTHIVMNVPANCGSVYINFQGKF